VTKSISRRTLLRGLGATVGLPLLEAMAPSPARGATPAKPPVRMLFVFVPMGVNVSAWTPKDEGADYTLSESLSPLAKVKQDVLVLTGLDLRREDAAGNSHPRGSATFLSSAPIGKVDNGGFCTDKSVDQLAAEHLGRNTRLASLELGCQRGVGKHASNISWRGPGFPMTKEINPRAVFTRLFGDPQGDASRRSILDLVLEDARQLRADLGHGDRQKMDEYLGSVRAIERELQAIEREQGTRGKPQVQLLDVGPTAGHHGYDRYPEHLRLMSELMVLAFQQDVTRVGTLMYGIENGGATGVTFRHLGINSDHHGLTHVNFQDQAVAAEAAEKVKKVDRWYVSEFARMLEKMKAIREGEGTLLDNSMVLYGSGISDGNWHNWTNVPILLAGKGGGTIDSGRHVRYAWDGEYAYATPNRPPAPAKIKGGAPLANLHLAMLDRVGVQLDRLADSTGRLANLTT
jgi:hypothetical protein